MLCLSGTSPYDVFVCLCICIFVFECFTHGNIIFDILEQSPIKNYTSSYDVFVNLCICIFLFAVEPMGIWFLISLNNPLFKTIPHVGFFWHLVIWCSCVFVYLYFCICVSDSWEYHFWYPWTILFSKIYHMLIN